MTLAQNCTGVKPDSSENESNTLRINLAASSNVTPRSLSRVVANFVCLSMVFRIRLSTYFYLHFIYSFIIRTYHEGKFFL